MHSKKIENIMDELAMVSESVTDAVSKFVNIVGNCNFDVSYGSLQILRAGDTDNIIVKCQITLKDDEGKDIIRKEFFCSNEITYKTEAPTKSKVPINLAVAIEKAQKEAFRRCCARFFCSEERPQIIRNQNIKISQTQVSKDKGAIRCKVTTEVEPLENYRNAYKAMCVLEDNTNAHLLFWYGVANKLKEEGKWGWLDASLHANSYISIIAKPGRYKGQLQYEVEDIVL